MATLSAISATRLHSQDWQVASEQNMLAETEAFVESDAYAGSVSLSDILGNTTADTDVEVDADIDADADADVIVDVDGEASASADSELDVDSDTVPVPTVGAQPAPPASTDPEALANAASLFKNNPQGILAPAMSKEGGKSVAENQAFLDHEMSSMVAN